MPSRKAAWKRCRAHRRLATVSCVVAVGLIADLTGCTRLIETATPHPAPRVGPILSSQVADLLSKHAQDKDGNRFVTVEPDSCAGVAREQDAPFIVEYRPAATDGGHWVTTAGHEVYVEEIVAVYASDFDPRAAVDGARAALASCRDTPFTVTDMKSRKYQFTMGPAPAADPRSPDIVVWAFHGVDWACDNAFIAAHNAAVELTTCGPVNGYDVGALAKDALKRIEQLANTTA